MKHLLFIILLLIPFTSTAKDKFWISNKIEIGYDKIFLSEMICIKSNEFSKNGIAIGLKFEIADEMSYKTFYLLEHARDNKWKNNHFLGVGFDFKLQ